MEKAFEELQIKDILPESWTRRCSLSEKMRNGGWII